MTKVNINKLKSPISFGNLYVGDYFLRKDFGENHIFLTIPEVTKTIDVDIHNAVDLANASLVQVPDMELVTPIDAININF